MSYNNIMNIILFEDNEINMALQKHDERAVHLIKILHKKEGGSFEAGILGGKSGKGKIEKINRDGSIIFSLDLIHPPLKRLPVRLAVGFPRPIQIRRILRDLSSLGVCAIDLFGTELGEKSYRKTNLLNDGGARTALIEGASQSRDTTLPQLEVYYSLEEWLKQCPWKKNPQMEPAILVAADNVRPKGTFAVMQGASSAVLAVGSERGWSEHERGLLDTAGFLRLSLGSRALRTETSCIAAAVLAIQSLGY